MARSRKNAHIVRTYRTAARSELGLIVPSMLLIPAVVYALFYFEQRMREVGTDVSWLDWRWFAVPVGVLLLFPLWAKFKTRFFSRFRVTLDSVSEEHGLFSKKSSEVRIQDIRNIVVEQSFLDRLLLIGDVYFSSAAGSDTEVRFSSVPRPGRIKELVRDIQNKLKDGELSEAETAEIMAAAGAKGRRERIPSAGEDAAAARARTPAAEPAPAKAGGEAAGRAEPSAAPVAQSRARSEAPAAEPRREPEPAAAPRKPATKPSDDDARDELYRLLAEQEADGKSES